MVLVVSAVTDKASAEQAVAELKVIAANLKKAQSRASTLGKPGAGRRAKLAAQMKSKDAELRKRLADSQATLQKAGPEATGILIEGMKELAPTMDELEALFEEPQGGKGQ